MSRARRIGGKVTASVLEEFRFRNQIGSITLHDGLTTAEERAARSRAHVVSLPAGEQRDRLAAQFELIYGETL